MPLVQLTMFGVPTSTFGVHRVSAHTRIRADGTEVFVSEHLRWSRGRAAPKLPKPTWEPPLPGQLALFELPEAK